MPEQQLNRPEILGSSVDQCRLGAAHRVGSVNAGVQSEAPGAQAAMPYPLQLATLLLPNPAMELGASITGVKVSAAPRAAAMAPAAHLRHAPAGSLNKLQQPGDLTKEAKGGCKRAC